MYQRLLFRLYQGKFKSKRQVDLWGKRSIALYELDPVRLVKNWTYPVSYFVCDHVGKWNGTTAVTQQTFLLFFVPRYEMLTSSFVRSIQRNNVGCQWEKAHAIVRMGCNWIQFLYDYPLWNTAKFPDVVSRSIQAIDYHYQYHPDHILLQTSPRDAISISVVQKNLTIAFTANYSMLVDVFSAYRPMQLRVSSNSFTSGSAWCAGS